MGEVFLLKGGSPDEVFGKVCTKVFGEVSRLVLLRMYRAKEIQQNFHPRNPTALHSKIGENSGKNFMTRFCKGTPANCKGQAQKSQLSDGFLNGFRISGAPLRYELRGTLRTYAIKTRAATDN